MMSTSVYYLIASTFEEIVFRGIILYSLLRLYGSSQGGIFKCVLVSSILFGLVHFTRGDMIEVMCRIFVVFLAGFFYGALMVRGRSLWIPVACHSLSNIAISILSAISFSHKLIPLIPYPEFWLILAQVPATLCGFYLILRTPPMKVVPEAP